MPTKAEIMSGVEFVSARIVDRNTVQYETADGRSVTRLHKTDIVNVAPNGDIVLNSGGYKTVTTKDRINNQIRPLYVSQKRGLWQLHNRETGQVVPFIDGMTLPHGNIPKPTRATANVVKRQINLRARILKFTAQLDTVKELPIPGSGDCWYCSMFDRVTARGAKGKTDPGHLREHVRENYLHGSLILNALAWAGYQNPSAIYQLNLRRSIKSALRRYLYRELGLVA